MSDAYTRLLYDSIRNGDIETVKTHAFIVGNKSRGLIWASENGQLEVVKYLVSIGALVTFRDCEAFRLACMGGYLEVVKYLVENGADIAADHNDAVARASAPGHIEVVKFLVERGADITVNNNLPILCASQHGRLETVKFLLSRGGDFNKLTDEHKAYFISLKVFKRWRTVIFRKFFRKTVIPLYYSPGFPGGNRAKKELREIIDL